MSGSTLKICFVGIGSIAKRHLVNLKSISKEFNIELIIHAFRKTETQLDSKTSNIIDRVIWKKQLLDSDYDIVFITNPPLYHFSAIQLLSQKTKHMFIEKPVFDGVQYKLEDLQLNEHGNYYVSAPLRHNSVIKYMGSLISKEKVLSVRSICSSYLPDWRTGVDYTKTYNAKSNQGGGVSNDIIHEWDYLIDFFGFPEKVYGIQGKYSNLKIDSDDIAIYIAKYDNKLLELHLDYCSRSVRREIEFITENGSIVGDLINNKVSFSYQDPIFFENNRNEMYMSEMRKFLNIILNGEANNSNLQKAYKVLQFIKGITK